MGSGHVWDSCPSLGFEFLSGHCRVHSSQVLLHIWNQIKVRMNKDNKMSSLEHISKPDRLQYIWNGCADQFCGSPGLFLFAHVSMWVIKLNYQLPCVIYAGRLHSHYIAGQRIQKSELKLKKNKLKTQHYGWGI